MNEFFLCLKCLDLDLVTSICEIFSFFISVIGLFLVTNVYNSTVEINKSIKVNNLKQDSNINGSGNMVIQMAGQSFVDVSSIKNKVDNIEKK